jgi:hypothetical protein
MVVCRVPTCPALAIDETDFCAVHLVVVKRTTADVPIKCYACGLTIRAGREYLVRTEGSFHLRMMCLSKQPSEWAIPVLT